MTLAFSRMVLDEVRTQLELGVTDPAKVADLVESLGGDRSQVAAYIKRAETLIGADKAVDLEYRAGRHAALATEHTAGRDYKRHLGWLFGTKAMVSK